MPAEVSVSRAAGLAYRSAGDSRHRVALLVHGWEDVPEEATHVLVDFLTRRVTASAA